MLMLEISGKVGEFDKAWRVAILFTSVYVANLHVTITYGNNSLLNELVIVLVNKHM